MRDQTELDTNELRRRRWGIVRLVLGQAQIDGATMTLIFLLQIGESSLTIWAAGAGAFVTLLSIVLFKSRWKRI